MKSEYGKKARAGWTRKFEEAWEKSLGHKCLACNGLGYFWDTDQNGNPIKINCLFCNSGKGKDG